MFNTLWLCTAVLLSHYRRHIGQGLFLLLGLVLGVALWSSVTLINSHAKASYQDADQLLGTQAKYLIRPGFNGSDLVPESILVELSNAGFTGLYPVRELSLMSESGVALSVIASNLEQLPGAQATFAPLPLYTLVPASIAEQLSVRNRQAIKLANGQFLPPAVIIDDQAGNQLITDLRYAGRLTSSAGFTYIGVPALSNQRIAALQASLPDSLQLVRNQQTLDLQELTDSLHIQLGALGWLAFVVGLFIVFNAVRFSLHSRTKTMQTLRELGTPTGIIALAIAIEALLWALLGTTLGGTAGFLLANLLLPAVAASLQSLFGAVVSPAVTLSAAHWLQAGLMTLLGVVLAIAGPLWLSATQKIKHQRQEKLPVILLVIAPLLLLVSAVLAANASKVTTSFVMLTFTLFGCALLLPVVLYLAAKAITGVIPQRFWRVRWAVSDIFAQLPHLRIAMMAVLLALVANIGVSLLVGSFRVALSDWLTVRLSASAYLQPEVDINNYRQNPEVLAAHTRYGVTERWQDRPAEILGVNTSAPDMRALPMESGERVWQANSVLANEQSKHLGGAKLGDTIELATETGLQPFVIRGFFHDYGNPYYSFYLAQDTLLQHWPNAEPLGHALWLDAPVANVLNELPAELWIDQTELLSIALAIFDRTFAITGALNTLTFAVAGIALFAALLSVHQQRMQQYQQWRALGVSGREWLMIVTAPIGLMVLLTFAVSVPIGIWLSALLINDINVIAFGWSMPLNILWQPFAWLLGFTVLMFALSSGIAAWRVHRML
ncbi:FtsX-like permease family protein [Salinibius halmophilus]|uniref:FtsX-like permease family protein n=1 Tax=Salinibius halmophilus TaxID=1853216 RepID=UPI000E65F0F8|nr:ABC transporter permease [Salinibius halmophilus]